MKISIRYKVIPSSCTTGKYVLLCMNAKKDSKMRSIILESFLLSGVWWGVLDNQVKITHCENFSCFSFYIMLS